MPSFDFAIVGSSAGSAFEAFDTILARIGAPIRPLIIVDRECGFETLSRSRGYVTHRIAFENATSFSHRVDDLLDRNGVSDVLLMYTRLVAEPLLSKRRVRNIHPSLLPAYRGLGAVDQALAAGEPELGCSLHAVDAGMDTGQLLSQVSCALPTPCSARLAHRLSYLQKVWLMLLWRYALERPLPVSLVRVPVRASPGAEHASHPLPEPAHGVYALWASQLEPVL